MNGLREGVSEIFRSLAKGQKVTYADLKELAKKNGVKQGVLYSETVWACGLAGVDAHSLVSTAPSYMRSPLKKQKKPGYFPRRGHHTGEDKAALPSRKRARDEWARRMGYKSWGGFPHREWLHRLGFGTRGEYEKADRQEAMERYAALLSNLYRAGIPKERADLLADLAITRKGIPRAGLKKVALRLSKLPLLYPGRKKRVLDASLQKYRKRFGKR